jgi:hypothetical protein
VIALVAVVAISLSAVIGTIFFWRRHRQSNADVLDDAEQDGGCDDMTLRASLNMLKGDDDDDDIVTSEKLGVNLLKPERMHRQQERSTAGLDRGLELNVSF